MQVKSNGIAINCRIDGSEGAPWLIWSNSLATDLDAWERQVQEFKSEFRVLRYDQRGHGATETPAGRYSFETLIADALGLMDALAISKAHFAGLSMGGATALGLAEKHPERLDRVIVCDFWLPIDSGQRAAVGRAHCDCANAGHGGSGRTDDHALVSHGCDQGQSTLS